MTTKLPPLASVSLEPDDTCPRQARRFLTEFCNGFSIDSDAEDSAILLVSELATNASRQTEGTVTVTAALTHTSASGNDTPDHQVARDPQAIRDAPLPRLRIEVTDQIAGQPTTGTLADPLAESGRGLALVETLAERWGVRNQTTQKTVWFELPI